MSQPNNPNNPNSVNPAAQFQSLVGGLNGRLTEFTLNVLGGLIANGHVGVNTTDTSLDETIQFIHEAGVKVLKGSFETPEKILEFIEDLRKGQEPNIVVPEPGLKIARSDEGGS